MFALVCFRSNIGQTGNDIGGIISQCKPFQPFYPASSRFVTAVSATFLSPRSTPLCNLDRSADSLLIAASEGFAPIDCSESDDEVAVSVRDGMSWTTGGGFSNLSFNLVPEYQREFVQQFIANQAAELPPNRDPHSGMTLWNGNLRGYADVSAIGTNFVVVKQRVLQTGSGTSASTPLFAALISLINDELMNRGLPPLGFLNPFLYSAKRERPAALRDVSRGSNIDGNVEDRCSPYSTLCQFGFYVAPGWNPVTGLGTPNFGELRDYAIQVAERARANRERAKNRDQPLSQEPKSSGLSLQETASLTIGLSLLTHLLLLFVQFGCSRFVEWFTDRRRFTRNRRFTEQLGVEQTKQPAASSRNEPQV